ncbi:unnamed protein product, partial [Gadus morhua 'NCC']
RGSCLFALSFPPPRLARLHVTSAAPVYSLTFFIRGHGGGGSADTGVRSDSDEAPVKTRWQQSLARAAPDRSSSERASERASCGGGWRQNRRRDLIRVDPHAARLGCILESLRVCAAAKPNTKEGAVS